MGELINFPSRKPEEDDISDTTLGREIIEGIAKPAFHGAIDAASEQTGFDAGIDLDQGEWTVVPLDKTD